MEQIRHLTRTITDAILPAVELGFRNGLRGAALDRLSFAAAQLKALLMRHHPDLTHHPTEPSLSYLYGVVLTDTQCAADETGLCFFANQYASFRFFLGANTN